MPYDQFNFFKELARDKLSKSRFEHCLAVAATSEELAIKFQVNPEKARLAGLLHDFYKETDQQTFIDLIKSQHYDLRLLNYNRGVWHGLIGADILKQEYDFFDEDILNAIRFHTVCNPQMNNLAKIVFVADYIEPNRRFPVAKKARKIVEQSLDAAVLYEIKMSITYLIDHAAKIFPTMLDTYNSLYTKNLNYQEMIQKVEKNWK